jgi:hypothetical protein
MAAINTDEPVRASRQSFQRRGIERAAVTLMYDKPPHIGIGMPSEVFSSKLIKIARARLASGDGGASAAFGAA